MNAKEKRANGIETFDMVLQFARQELDDVGAVKFNILRVIEKSGVSRSSVYHHFGSRDGVITAVEMTRLFAEMGALNDVLRQFAETSESLDEVLSIIETVLVAASSPEGRRARAHRISLVAVAKDIPQMAEQLSQCQRLGDAHVAESLRIAQGRGLTKSVINPEGIAHLVSSLFLGRSMVDQLGSDPADSAWVATVMDVLRYLLKPE